MRREISEAAQFSKRNRTIAAGTSTMGNVSSDVTSCSAAQLSASQPNTAGHGFEGAAAKVVMIGETDTVLRPSANM